MNFQTFVVEFLLNLLTAARLTIIADKGQNVLQPTRLPTDENIALNIVPYL